MAASISIGLTCRDLQLLGGTEDEVRQFFDLHLGPALLNEVMSRRQLYMDGIGAVTRADISPELEARGCSVGGSISISF